MGISLFACFDIGRGEEEVMITCGEETTLLARPPNQKGKYWRGE
jgi:hypothetical protein